MLKFLSARTNSVGPYLSGRNADLKIDPLEQEGYKYPDQFYLPQKGAYLVVPMQDGRPKACLIIEGGIPWYAKFYDQTGEVTETWVTCSNLVSYRWANIGNGDETFRVIKPFCTMVVRETEPSFRSQTPQEKIDHSKEFELWRKGFEELIQYLPQIQVSEKGSGADRRIKVTHIPARHLQPESKSLYRFASPGL